MKRAALRWALFAALQAGLFAQEPAAAPEPSTAGHAAASESGHEGGDSEAMWKWANFVILAGALGWLISKHAPGFFRARTEQIQRGIAEAAKQRQEAENRAAKMEMRMASLSDEIEQIRAEARAEIARESERIRRETELAMARIGEHGEREVAAISKHAEKELRAFAAQLAIQLSEQRILARMSESTQESLVDGFLRHLEQHSESGRARQ